MMLGMPSMKCSTYLLAVVVLLSRCTELTLYYVSDISNWCWYIFTPTWCLLLAAALWSLFLAQWRTLGICSIILAVTGVPAINVGRQSITQIQDDVFRFYAVRLINAVPLREFLAKCKSVDYADDNGKRQQVAQCDNGIRSIPWLHLSVIYDPSGELSLPGYYRSITWRLAVQGWTKPPSRPGASLHFGSVLAGTDRRTQLVGAFYYVKFYADEWTGDDER